MSSLNSMSRSRLRLLGNHLHFPTVHDEVRAASSSELGSGQLQTLSHEFHQAFNSLRKDILECHSPPVVAPAGDHEHTESVTEQLRRFGKEQRAMRRLLEQSLQDVQDVLEQQKHLSFVLEHLSQETDRRGLSRISKDIIFRRQSSFRTTVRNPSAKFLHAFDEDPNAVLEDDLRDALLHRWEPSVRSLLNRSADPNVVYWGVACGGTTFTWCTPLCIAATLGNLGIARALLEAGALPNSQYAMPSGAAKQEHTFQAAFAALPGGDLRMLRLLVDADADVGERSPTSNASLLWHAADLGHAEVVRFLLDQGAELESSAVSPDDSDLRCSALHIAVVRGHHMVVEMLLEAGASHCQPHSNANSPLGDAFLYRHPKVVEILLQHGASIVESQTYLTCRFGIRPLFAMASGPKKAVDLLWDQRSIVLTSAAARGLQKCPGQLTDLRKEDYIGFLGASSYAPKNFISALFEAVPTHRMRYFDQTGRRREPTMMYVEGGFSDTSKTNMNTVIGLNVAAGPHRKHFAALYEVEQALREDSLAFMHQLTPWSRRRACTTHLSQTLFRRDYSLTGASLYMCRVPGIHEDFQVMLTMACNPCDDMYAEHGCQAIVQFWWSKWKIRSVVRFQVLEQFLYLFSFWIWVFASRNTSFEFPHVWSVCYELVVVTMLFLDGCGEVLQFIGHVHYGQGQHWMYRPSNWYDIGMMITMGAGVVIRIQLGEDAFANWNFRVLSAFIVAVRWGQLLKHLNRIQAVGPHVLPIENAMQGIMGFLFVIVLVLCGITHAFFCLNFSDSFWQEIDVIYRMAILSDASLQDIQDIEPHGSVTDSSFQIEDPSTVVNGIHVVYVLVFMVMVTLAVSIVLLNIFIAILGQNYEREYRRAWTKFLQTRARAISNIRATQIAVAVVVDNFTFRKSRFRKKVMHQEKVHHREHLWYSCGTGSRSEA